MLSILVHIRFTCQVMQNPCLEIQQELLMMYINCQQVNCHFLILRLRILSKELTNQNEILHSLEHASWNRLFHIYDAIKLGIPFKTIVEKTKIDIWFLKQIEELIKFEKQIEKFNVSSLPQELLFEGKQKGYCDRQIAHLLKCLESEVYKKRTEMGIKRVYKLVDTCAAEFKALTPYYYSTFEAEIQTADGTQFVHNESIMILKKNI